MSFFLLNLESGGNVSGRELQRLRKKNVQLEEENNLLKLKIEILLDMVRMKLWSGPYFLKNMKCALYQVSTQRCNDLNMGSNNDF